MVKIEELAIAALNYDSLQLSALTQALFRDKHQLREHPKPETNDQRILSVSAGLLELFAQQWHQEPPTWTADIGPMPEPFFLLKYAKVMKSLRLLCENESPESLRKRELYATPNFLEFA
ncbi:hypothetical protein BGP_3672 [Beggiatoa sp. PS]|nr:hypothetical protein BGP_3672 [Beggiatoa sp. PS]